MLWVVVCGMIISLLQCWHWQRNVYRHNLHFDAHKDQIRYCPWHHLVYENVKLGAFQGYGRAWRAFCCWLGEGSSSRGWETFWLIAMVFERKYSYSSRSGQTFIDEQLIRNCLKALEKRIRQLKLLTSTGNIQGRKIILKCFSDFDHFESREQKW